MVGSDFIVRDAVLADTDQIGKVHVETWQIAYADLVPKESLENLDPAQRAAQWVRNIEALETKPAEFPAQVLVALKENQVIGFLYYRPSRDEGAYPPVLEIITLYVLPEFWGTGAADKLMQMALDNIATNTPITLWVLKNNNRAISFYQRYGFIFDGTEKEDHIPSINHTITEQRLRRN